MIVRSETNIGFVDYTNAKFNAQITKTCILLNRLFNWILLKRKFTFMALVGARIASILIYNIKKPNIDGYLYSSVLFLFSKYFSSDILTVDLYYSVTIILSMLYYTIMGIPSSATIPDFIYYLVDLRLSMKMKEFKFWISGRS